MEIIKSTHFKKWASKIAWLISHISIALIVSTLLGNRMAANQVYKTCMELIPASENTSRTRACMCAKEDTIKELPVLSNTLLIGDLFGPSDSELRQIYHSILEGCWEKDIKISN